MAEMKLFKRDNGIWYVRVNSQKRVSLRTKDKREAEKLFKILQKKYYQEKIYKLENKGYVYLSEAIEEYLDYKEKTVAEKTIISYKATLTKFLSIVTDKPVNQIVKSDIDLFFNIRMKEVKKISVSVDYRNLKAFFNYLLENECIKKNYVKDFKIKTEKKLPSFLTKEEVKKLFEIIEDDMFKVLFAMYIYTGRRRNEILNLTINDIDVKNNRMKYYNQKKKMYNVIPIIPELQKYLYPYLEKNKFKINSNPQKKVFNVHESTVTHKFKRYFRQIGREDVKLHSLRHTFASHLIMSGASIKEVQELLDHSDISTTMIYLHLTEDYRYRALQKLSFE